MLRRGLLTAAAVLAVLASWAAASLPVGSGRSTCPGCETSVVEYQQWCPACGRPLRAGADETYHP